MWYVVDSTVITSLSLLGNRVKVFMFVFFWVFLKFTSHMVLLLEESPSHWHRGKGRVEECMLKIENLELNCKRVNKFKLHTKNNNIELWMDTRYVRIDESMGCTTLDLWCRNSFLMGWGLLANFKISWLRKRLGSSH